MQYRDSTVVVDVLALLLKNEALEKLGEDLIRGQELFRKMSKCQEMVVVVKTKTKGVENENVLLERSLTQPRAKKSKTLQATKTKYF